MAANHFSHQHLGDNAKEGLTEVGLIEVDE
jgi:hypothetical protein